MQTFHCIEHHNISSHHDAIYEFIEEIPIQTNDFKFTKDFTGGFTEIQVGEAYAIDGDTVLKNNFSTSIFVGIPAKNPKKGDGAGFLFYKK